MKEQYNYCHIVGSTDKGRVRKANEDNMGSAETINGLVAVVCDGMGGHVGGATASHIAVNTIVSFLNDKYYEDPRIAIGEAIDAANNAILKNASENSELDGMGSTCVLLLVRNGKIYYGHVGDSRIYLVRNRIIKQLTKDHSYVQTLVDAGKISEAEAERHPQKNVITNALGLANMSPATVNPDAINPEAGDCFVLCSDGLSGMVSDKDIEKIVSRQREISSQERADQLVEMANRNGGVDNITVQLVEISVTPTPPNPIIKKWMKYVALLFCALLGFSAFFYFKGCENTPGNSSDSSGASSIVVENFVDNPDLTIKDGETESSDKSHPVMATQPDLSDEPSIQPSEKEVKEYTHSFTITVADKIMLVFGEGYLNISVISNNGNDPIVKGKFDESYLPVSLEIEGFNQKQNGNTTIILTPNEEGNAQFSVVNEDVRRVINVTIEASKTVIVD